MCNRVALAVYIGIFAAYVIVGGTLAYWAITCTKDQAEVSAVMRLALPVLGCGVVGLILLAKPAENVP